MKTFSFQSLSIYMAAGLLQTQMANAAGCFTAGLTFSITSQTDANALSGCGSIASNLIIAPSSTQSISLNGITSIGGSLTLENGSNGAVLTSFSAPVLTSIGGALVATNVSSIDFPVLAAVNSVSITA